MPSSGDNDSTGQVSAHASLRTMYYVPARTITYRDTYPLKDRNSRIRKGEITLSFPELFSKNSSSGESADREALLLFVKLDNEIR